MKAPETFIAIMEPVGCGPLSAEGAHGDRGSVDRHRHSTLARAEVRISNGS